MTEIGERIKQGRFTNHPSSMAGFLREHDGSSWPAALEAARNWRVMKDWLEKLLDDVTVPIL